MGPTGTTADDMARLRLMNGRGPSDMVGGRLLSRSDRVVDSKAFTRPASNLAGTVLDRCGE
jgi:hypothetical protein